VLLVFYTKENIILAKALNKRISTLKVYEWCKFSADIIFIIRRSISGTYQLIKGIGLNKLEIKRNLVLIYHIYLLILQA
jgi:hypothetical protein